jgi:hypothetical protein
LAWKYLTRDERFANWTLIHGEITSPIGNGKPMEHAWLEHQDKIYDPVHDVEFDSAEYQAKYISKAIGRYSRQEALRAALDHGHFGPWR